MGIRWDSGGLLWFDGSKEPPFAALAGEGFYLCKSDGERSEKGAKKARTPNYFLDWFGI